MKYLGRVVSYSLAIAVGLVTAGTVPLSSQEQTHPTTLTKGELYDHYLTGSDADVSPATTGGVLLAGGGTDQPDAFRWLIKHAGGGDLVVLRASGADGYHPFVMKLGGIDSIETFLVKSRDASSDPNLLARLGRAEAIFFAGGDQSKYITFFKDTPVETPVNAAAARGVPIGGTSAGLAILSEFSYSAMNASITTDQAMANPLSTDITLDRDFLSLPHLAGIITDSHVVERGRLGRTVTFMARLHQDGWLAARGTAPARPARALAIDRETAVLLERDGTATVVGPNTAYFMEAAQPPQRYAENTPLTYFPITVYKVTKASTFNFTTWTGTGGTPMVFEITNGVFSER